MPTPTPYLVHRLSDFLYPFRIEGLDDPSAAQWSIELRTGDTPRLTLTCTDGTTTHCHIAPDGTIVAEIPRGTFPAGTLYIRIITITPSFYFGGHRRQVGQWFPANVLVPADENSEPILQTVTYVND